MLHATFPSRNARFVIRDARRRSESIIFRTLEIDWRRASGAHQRHSESIMDSFARLDIKLCTRIDTVFERLQNMLNRLAVIQKQ